MLKAIAAIPNAINPFGIFFFVKEGLGIKIIALPTRSCQNRNGEMKKDPGGSIDSAICDAAIDKIEIPKNTKGIFFFDFRNKKTINKGKNK